MSQDLSNKKQRKGYSLIELMMAVLFFGIAAVAISPPLTNSMNLTVNDKNINNANNLARSYLRELQDSWKIQSVFDQGVLVAVGDEYTYNGNYNVTVNAQDIESDTGGNVILRRVNIVYTDSNANMLCDLFYDYNRP